MREYIVSYRAGTSPYRYNASVYATSAAGAYLQFVWSDRCPGDVRDIEIKAI